MLEGFITYKGQHTFKVKDMQLEFKIENITDQINYYDGKVF